MTTTRQAFESWCNIHRARYTGDAAHAAARAEHAERQVKDVAEILLPAMMIRHKATVGSLDSFSPTVADCLRELGYTPHMIACAGVDPHTRVSVNASHDIQLV